LAGKIIFCTKLNGGAATDDDVVISDYISHVIPGQTYLADKVWE